jgi:hypothetical protein
VPADAQQWPGKEFSARISLDNLRGENPSPSQSAARTDAGSFRSAQDDTARENETSVTSVVKGVDVLPSEQRPAGARQKSELLDEPVKIES